MSERSVLAILPLAVLCLAGVSVTPAIGADRAARALEALLSPRDGVLPRPGVPTPAAPATAQGVRDGDVLPIGAAISLSGRQAGLAAHMIKGYEFAAARVNADGGVLVGNRRYRIELRLRDDESNPATARIVTNELADAGIGFILGPFSSGLVDAAAEITEARRIPMVQAGGASLSLFDKGRRFMFGLVSTTDQYLSGVVGMLADHLLQRGRPPGSLRVALAFPDDAVGREMRASILALVARWEMEVVVDEVLPSPVTDLGDLFSRILVTRPDALLLSAYAAGALLTVQQSAAMRVFVPLIALTHCDGAGIERLGPIADYVVCATQWDAYANYRDRWFGTSVDFLVEFELAFGQPPTYQAAQGAAALLVLVDAIERAGSLDGEAVRRALARTETETFFGPIRFDSTGRNVDKPMLLQQLQGGRYKVVWPAQVAWTRLVYPVPRWEDRP